MFRRLGEWAFAYGTRVETSAVDDPVRYRVLKAVDTVLAAVSIGLLVIHGYAARDSLTYLVVSGVCGWLVGRAAFLGVRRANAYRAGWLDGRRAMVYSMMEARSRGMTPGQWITSQLEIDAAILGIRFDDEHGPGEVGSQ